MKIRRGSLLASALLLALPSCRQPFGPAPNSNVIMICLDSVRPDHLGCYGYSRDTSPNLDRIAAGGMRFTDAVTNATWTLPSILTLFTSTYPSAHGRDTYDKDYNREHPLPADAPVLPRFLAEKGWATAGFSHGGWTAKAFGFDRWFDHWDEGPLFEIDQMVPRCLTWIDSHRDRPFFIYLHTLSPHFPYRPQGPYRAKFGIDEEKYIPPEMDWLPLLDQAKAGKVGERLLKQIIRQYDGGIAFTDEAIGKLAAGLQERGLDNKTLLVVFADHGEQFLEHGLIFHGANAFEETARIPLILAGPGIQPGTLVDRQFELVDILPTLFDYLSLPLPPRKIQGISLLSRKSGDRSWALTEDNLSQVQALRRFPWKYVNDIMNGRVELYNLEKDPGEKKDVAAENPGRMKKLAALLERRNRENASFNAFLAQTGAERRVLPSGVADQLKALGYVQ
jgi:arylsulfatase A-like enzyme